MLIKFLCNLFIFTFILILIFIMIILVIIIMMMIISIIINIIIILIMIMIILTIHIIKMETIFMNTQNSKTNESHRFKLDLADKLNLKNPKKTWL